MTNSYKYKVGQKLRWKGDYYDFVYTIIQITGRGYKLEWFGPEISSKTSTVISKEDVELHGRPLSKLEQSL